jgi:phosphosulfolactate synthase
MLTITHPRDDRKNRKGKTIVMDLGTTTDGWCGRHGLADLLEAAGNYIDAAKLFVFHAATMPESYLRSVIKQYKDAGIMVFAGGLLFEYAYLKNEFDGLIKRLKWIGVDGIEVSENYIDLTDDERMKYISALSKAGLEVVFEYGRKHPEKPMELRELEAVVKRVGEIGAHHIIWEQGEFDMLAKERPDDLKALVAAPWYDNVCIEVDSGAGRFPHAQLIKQFGPNLNFANVAPGQVILLENTRRGISRELDCPLFADLMAERNKQLSIAAAS